MIETSVNGVENTVAPKKNRRGVSNKTQAVAQLKFHEKDASPANGLFVGHLDSVDVEWSVNNESKIFTGISIPRVVLHFASNHQNVIERRHAYYNILPVESNVNTIPNGSEEWKVNNVFSWIKHILEVFYLKGREFTPEEEDALSLTFNDYDDENNYIPVEQEDVINGYRHMFENFVAMMNGEFNLKEGEVAKPCYKTVDGKFIPCWIKLIRHKKRNNKWINVAANGDLGFDGFLGNGVVELVRKDAAPAVLRLDLSRESITPKEVNQTPNIGTPNMGVPVAGAVVNNIPNTPFGLPGDNSAFNAADSEMPF